MVKKTFLLLILSLFASSVFAQFGVLTVSSNTNQKFWLFIDDVLQNEYATHSIKIQGLFFIPYKVRVEMDNRINNCVGQTIIISNIPNNNNFLISVDRANNYIFGKARSMPNPFFIQTVIMPDYSYFSAYQQYLFPGFNPNVNYGQSQYKGSQYKRPQYNYQGSGPSYGGNQGYNQGPGYGNPPGQGNPGYGTPPQGRCMPTPDFSRAYSAIQGESFEESKFNTAKQITSNNWLCVSQIVQICKLFSFEQTKLDFAKFAYRYCVDQNNYYQLNEVFTYSASKDELRRYIDGR
jgi:hypothetical protein